MSADATAAIGPVSVRYAAQIRELLHVQAVQRMAADQEAARAKAEAVRAEAIEKPVEADPLHARIDTREPTIIPAPTHLPETGAEAPAPQPGQLVDIQA